MTEPDLVVGVIGGLGPLATVDFFAKVVAATKASCDQEHLRLVIDNHPQIPDRTAAILGRGQSPVAALTASAKLLDGAGVDFVVMPCNTAHHWAGDVRAALSVPLVSIIDETISAAQDRSDAKGPIAIMATEGCLVAGVYQRALEARGMSCLVPEGQARAAVMHAIYGIKSGGSRTQARASLADVAGELVARGAVAVVAGCTEIPLALTGDDVAVPLLDATAILAERTVAYAKRQSRLPR